MDRAQAPPRRERQLIAILALAAFGSAASMRVTDAQLPALATHFGIGLAAAAQVITVFAVTYGLMQLAYGPLGDRLGKWRVIGAAVSASAVTAAACALAPSYSLLLAARLLAGATCAGIIPLAMAWIGDAVPYERRQPVLARFLIGQILGLGCGQWLGGLAADLGIWQLPFAALALWFLLCMALLWRARGEGAAASPPQAAGGHLLRQVGGVLRLRWARTVLATVFAEGVLMFGALAFFATHLHLAQRLSLTAAGGIVTLYAAGGLLFALWSPALVRRLGEPGLAQAGGVLIALGLLAVALSPLWWTAPAACLAAGVGLYMLHNTLQTNATQMAPHSRGVAVSLFASAFFLGQTVGVALAALAVERFGTRATIAACAPLLLALAWCFARLRRAHVAAA